MNILLTGHDGYIGAVMMPFLQAAGHRVRGVDSKLFEGCDFGPYEVVGPEDKGDVRDLAQELFQGVDAVIHLAAISNDPLGNLNPDCTYAINHRASVRAAELAKGGGRHTLPLRLLLQRVRKRRARPTCSTSRLRSTR